MILLTNSDSMDLRGYLSDYSRLKPLQQETCAIFEIYAP
jgi:hypothetical protein